MAPSTSTMCSYDSISYMPETYHFSRSHDHDNENGVDQEEEGFRRAIEQRSENHHPHRLWRRVKIAATISGVVLYICCAAMGVLAPPHHSLSQVILLSSRNKGTMDTTTTPILGLQQFHPRTPKERCEHVITIMESQNAGKTREQLAEAYPLQVQDANVFYRATARIFWQDFVAMNWGSRILRSLNAKLEDGTEIQDKTTWTWVTGDQHLSNFGAWRSRSGKVVFGVNDFDEAAIYDFHVDVIRLSVSIYNHAKTNGLHSNKKLRKILRTFTKTYVKTVIGYVGNEDALTFELTVDTAEGKLKKFLKKIDQDKSDVFQITKFTDTNGTFIFNDKTRLLEIDPELEHDIVKEFVPYQYGATMMKMGWHVHQWDDNYFSVVDVARRIGSGIGSYGVDRFYVLLNGTQDREILLDVKYEPEGAVNKVLSDEDKAWYSILFRNDAARAVEAQRRLSSFTDPFTGWVLIRGRPFVVRQKSPWKASLDLDKLTDYHDFKTFIKMVAIATATSHTRGTHGKSPGEFKHVIAQILHSNEKREAWGDIIFKLAGMYSEQVFLDYQCFKNYVETNYTTNVATMSSSSQDDDYFRKNE